MDLLKPLLEEISIHTALAGCDRDGIGRMEAATISIHTALAGCDLSDPFFCI